MTRRRLPVDLARHEIGYRPCRLPVALIVGWVRRWLRRRLAPAADTGRPALKTINMARWRRPRFDNGAASG